MTGGKVKWWDDTKGYGVVIPDELFVHHTAIQMEGFRTLKEGQRVDFDPTRGPKGLQAANVRPLEGPGPPVLPKPNRRKLVVFLCHSSGDKPAVRKLFDRLSDVPYLSLWFDEKNLLPGQDWNLEITQAVKKADCVVICLSASSVNKEGYVQKEITFALDVADEKPERTIYLIPLRLEPCKPPTRLERWHYVDFFEHGGFERLMLSLQKRATDLGILLGS